MSTPDERAAYDAARATVLREHVYKTDSAQLESTCACGVTAPTIDIGRHIEEAAEKAGRAATAT